MQRRNARSSLLCLISLNYIHKRGKLAPESSKRLFVALFSIAVWNDHSLPWFPYSNKKLPEHLPSSLGLCKSCSHANSLDLLSSHQKRRLLKCTESCAFKSSETLFLFEIPYHTTWGSFDCFKIFCCSIQTVRREAFLHRSRTKFRWKTCQVKELLRTTMENEATNILFELLGAYVVRLLMQSKLIKHNKETLTLRRCTVLLCTFLNLFFRASIFNDVIRMYSELIFRQKFNMIL